MLLVTEGDKSNGEEDELRGVETEVMNGVELLLNSVVGLTEPRTIKLKERSTD